MGSDNGLSPGRSQAIISTNAGIFLIGPLETNFSEIFIEIKIFSLTNLRLKVSSAKVAAILSRPQCVKILTMNRVPPEYSIRTVMMNSQLTYHKTNQIQCDCFHLTHWGRDKMAAISQTTLANIFPWMQMLEFWYKFHWSLFLRVQLTIFQHWFR